MNTVLLTHLRIPQVSQFARVFGGLWAAGNGSFFPKPGIFVWQKWSVGFWWQGESRLSVMMMVMMMMMIMISLTVAKYELLSTRIYYDRIMILTTIYDADADDELMMDVVLVGWHPSWCPCTSEIWDAGMSGMASWVPMRNWWQSNDIQII